MRRPRSQDFQEECPNTAGVRGVRRERNYWHHQGRQYRRRPRSRRRTRHLDEDEHDNEDDTQESSTVTQFREYQSILEPK
jgi:hypothetical protein